MTVDSDLDSHHRSLRLLDVASISFDDISREAFERRQPDYVIVSSAGIAGITSRYTEDWSIAVDEIDGFTIAGRGIDGDPLTLESQENREFLDALRAERLGYARIAHFQPASRIGVGIMKGLSPEIEVYRRRTD